MINVKISSKHASMHNNDVNYVFQSSKNNELNAQKCMLSLSFSCYKYEIVGMN